MNVSVKARLKIVTLKTGINVVLFVITTLFSIVTHATPKAFYVHNDHRGAPIAMTDANQELVWRVVYRPYGEVVKLNATENLAIRFPGQRQDDITGVYYNHYRDYDPSLGRYVQSDPIGLAGGTNTYAYVGGNPVNYIDPKGLDILVIENGPTSGNPIGHTAIAVTGHGLASSGNSTKLGSSVTDYLLKQSKRRDTTVYILRTNSQQDEQAWENLKKGYKYRGLPYTAGNCSDLSNDALNAAGFDNTLMPNIYPGSAGDRSINAAATPIFIPKNSTTLPSGLSEFNP